MNTTKYTNMHMNTSNDKASKLVEIIKGMKPREQNKCIQKILAVVEKSTLHNSFIIDEWLHSNGFLCEEKYV